ncbi:MAG: GreA/GreB family elongation factor [Chlamydiota bacterium]|nr:GreA/GreB family elongation factor [Chlamydiota bacterium]
MSYLKEIETQIRKRDFSKFLLLWEEYCGDDSVDAEEYAQILEKIKASDFAVPFGKYIELGIPLWEKIEDKNKSYNILRLIIDLQTSNNPSLAKKATTIIEEQHSEEPDFNERMRLIGLRPLGDFKGCISNYDLLAHMGIGKCVFHTGGWGTGEIVDLSPIREQLAIEFEYLAGRKYVTFKNAFKSLVPIADDHFLARRFVNPDKLEAEAKKNAVAIIKILLRDLGPLTAGEIKDELCELVIPEKEWTKWWQNARVKLKKDTLIETPSSLKEPFILRNKEVTHEEQLHKDMHGISNIFTVIQTSYNYVRDFPNMLKKEGVKDSIKEKFITALASDEIFPHQELQIYIFLENLLDHHLEKGKSVKEIIMLSNNVEDLIDRVEIIAFKKRALVALREYREDWADRFLSLLTKISQSQLRDYILKELTSRETKPMLEAKFENLLHHPLKAPETFVWYFQKLLGKGNSDLPFSDKLGVCRFAESFLVLLHKVENKAEYRDLTKKMYQILTNKRYENVRHIFEGSSIQFIKEFLLLASKCHTFTSHDHKILNSLATVVHSELGPEKKAEDRLQLDGRTVWTTEAGYLKTQERAKQIGTVDIVENAKEVEAARALGDLRENSEYKYAVERRRQLQGELKRLSDELNRARVITAEDVSIEEIGIGNIVELSSASGNKQTYTILGPWDADPEKHVLSFQSKLAQTMIGRKVNDKFSFRDEEYQIADIRSYLDS